VDKFYSTRVPKTGKAERYKHHCLEIECSMGTWNGKAMVQKHRVYDTPVEALLLIKVATHDVVKASYAQVNQFEARA
jgi:hypothetical protein